MCEGFGRGTDDGGSEFVCNMGAFRAVAGADT